MLNLYYGIFSNTTFSIFHVAVCVPPYTQTALLRYNTFKILYNVLFMIYTHWTTIMFEDIIKVLAVRFLFQQTRPCNHLSVPLFFAILV